jgi:hypothetical protein
MPSESSGWRIDDRWPGAGVGRYRAVGDELDIATVWAEVQAALPAGWALDSLRCAGTGLAVEQRSADWIAVALAGDGTEVQSRAASPAAALRGLPGRVGG